MGAMRIAYDVTIAEPTEANWVVGGPCTTLHERVDFQVERTSGTGSCELYANWATGGTGTTPFRSTTPGPIPNSDPRYCGIVVGIYDATCRIQIREKRVCP